VIHYTAEQIEDLVHNLSDFHKDVTGRRPQLESMTTGEKIALHERLHASLDQKKTTVEGRKALRQEGWTVAEPIDEDIKRRLLEEPITMNAENAKLLHTRGRTRSKWHESTGYIVIGLTEQQGYLLGVCGREASLIKVEIGYREGPFGASFNLYKSSTLHKTISKLCLKQQVLFLAFPDRDQENLDALATELLYGQQHQRKAIHERLTGQSDTCLRYDPFDL
jgi:hypothetical protein